MKKILILLITISAITSNITAQSISPSKIFEYLASHNLSFIKNDLEKRGFNYKIDKRELATMHLFTKGLETVGVTLSEEQKNVFILNYIVNSKEYFNKLVENFKTDDMEYVNSYKNNDYYKNKMMMLGINELNNVITFTIKIK